MSSLVCPMNHLEEKGYMLVLCWEKQEAVEMVTHVLGRKMDDVLRHWLDLPNNHGGMHVMILWYSQTNERVH